MAAAMDGMDTVHYLVHALGQSGFAGEDLSAHLASRNEVGDVFLNSSVPAVVLQAAVIIGSGSASFEMLRHLTEAREPDTR